NDQQAQVADLADVTRNEMRPFYERVAIDGPRLVLVAKAAQNFALAVHELATNAAKYGALSNATGYVRISWSVDEPHATLNFRWEERGIRTLQCPRVRVLGASYLNRGWRSTAKITPHSTFDRRGVTYAAICSLSAVSVADTPDMDDR